MSEDREQHLSPAVEDYLKAIYDVQQRTATATTSMIAERLGRISPASVTGMIKRLASMGLVTYTPWRGVHLTADGERAALRVIRRHRLAELFLVRMLGYGWDEVHTLADHLEHVISDELDARLTQRLGDPTCDPHGDPIPTGAGSVPMTSSTSVAELPVGGQGCVVRVGDQEPDRLRYLAGLGLVPGAFVHVRATTPFGDPVSIEVGGRVQAIGRVLAQAIFVDPSPAGAPARSS